MNHTVSIGDFHYAESFSEMPKLNNYRIHSHSKYEVLYFERGDANCVIGNLKHKMQCGELVIIPPLFSHYIEILSQAPYERVVLNFSFCDVSENVIKKVFSSPKILTADDNEIKNLFMRFKKYRKSFAPADRDKLFSGLLTELIYLLSFHCDDENFVAFDGWVDSADKIIRFIDENLFEDISVESLTKQFYLSPAYLHKILKNALGMSPMCYIRTRRLTAAKEMLELGEKATFVANKVGYGDYTSFYRAYVKCFGVSPSEVKSKNSD